MKINLAKGYWQTTMAEKGKEKTVFRTPQDLFQFRKMPFGMVTTLMSFARMMRKLKLEENKSLSFFDDILITTETWHEHVAAVDQVLAKPGARGLTMCLSKVEAGFEDTEFLGHVVGGGVMRPVKDKVSKILNLSVPTTKQVRALIGLVSYYRCYIPNFTHIVSP